LKDGASGEWRALKRDAGDRILFHFDGQSPDFSEQTRREQSPQTRFMTDDRNHLAAFLAEQGQDSQRGASRREFGRFFGRRPAGDVRQNLRSLPGANQGTGQQAIGRLAELL
jgi:hypothetical protein